MSDSEEPEYEVESVLAAKVEPASRSKKAKLIWKYHVKWKGYTENDNTWEPIDSFDGGSEHLVEAFWKRSSTHGRDIEDMSLFKAGEEFRPIGPPRHKRKSAEVSASEPTPKASPEESTAHESVPPKATGKTPQKRQRSPNTSEVSGRSAKRSREVATGHPHPVASTSNPVIQSPYGTRSKASTTSASAPVSSRRQSGARARSSPEIIPDSDEEKNGGDLLHMPSISASKRSTKRSSKSINKAPEKQRSPPIVIEDSPSPVRRHPSPQPQQVEENHVPKIPAHRARLANPRVKLIDDSEFLSMEGNISAKTRAVKNINAEASASTPDKSPARATRSRPGPGRNSSTLIGNRTSSLLTAEKGALKTVKRRASTRLTAKVDPDPVEVSESMDVDATSDMSFPAPEEMLRMAGLTTEAAEALSDFEDEEEPAGTNLEIAAVPEPLVEANDNAVPPAISDADEKEKERSLRKESLDLAKNNLFPPQATSQAANDTMKWGKSTIFDPLSLGSASTTTDQSNSVPLFLNLDSSVSIPIFASESYVSAHFSLNQKMGAHQPPGKFYEPEAALSLLATVRATGQSAVIALADSASAEEKSQFELFQRRLDDGEIFVAVVGIQIHVFSSSNNTFLSSRLNAPANILNQPGKVMISDVVVENLSGYADAASKADQRRWTQYVPTK